jgi:hypothetical protein
MLLEVTEHPERRDIGSALITIQSQGSLQRVRRRHLFKVLLISRTPRSARRMAHLELGSPISA